MAIKTWKKRCVALGQWVKQDDGVVASLIQTLFIIMAGLTMLVLAVWFSSAETAYNALSNAARSAAFAGQTQVTLSQPSGNDGVGTNASFVTNSTQAIANAQTLWNTAVQNLNMSGQFTNLNANITVQGNDVVVVATGTYTPNWFDGLFKAFPAMEPSGGIGIPMKVTVHEQFYGY